MHIELISVLITALLFMHFVISFSSIRQQLCYKLRNNMKTMVLSF